MQITPFYSGRMAYDVTADNGEKYVFVPEEFVNKGFIQDGEQNYEPAFLQPGAFANAASITLPSDANFSQAARSLYSNPNKGFIWRAEDFAPLNADDFSFTSYKVTNTAPAIQGLTSFSGAPVYATTTKPGYDVTYINDPSGTFRSYKAGESLLGKAFGGWVDDFLSATGIQNLANQANDFFQTDEGKALKFAAMIASLGSSSFGEAGVQAAQEEAAQEAASQAAQDAAYEQAAQEAAYQASVDQALQQATAQTAAEQAASQAASQAAAEQAAAAQAAEIAAQNAAWDAAAIDLANSASPEFAASAAAQGLTFKQALDYARAGMLINSITGDPLGLNEVTGSGTNTFAQSGFAQVPVPSEWKSPTYTYSPVQNVTFEDLFPNVSLQQTQWQGLQGNQWEGLSGNQWENPQTYNPVQTQNVDINQIVGSILGQSTTG